MYIYIYTEHLTFQGDVDVEIWEHVAWSMRLRNMLRSIVVQIFDMSLTVFDDFCRDANSASGPDSRQ